LILIFTLIAALSVSHAAEGLSFTASVDRNRIALSDSLLLTLSVSGTGRAPEPSLPALPEFDVSSRGSSSRVEIINGKMTAQTDYQYELIPKQAGNLIIGAATLDYKGHTYRTDPIRIFVEKTSTTQKTPGNLFLTTDVSIQTPYVGQQILYRLRFFRHIQVVNTSLSELKFDGFRVEDLGKEMNYDTIRKGIRYQVTEVRKILSPVGSGEITIPGVTLRCEVPARRQNGLDPFFGDSFFNLGIGPTRTRVLRTEPIRITVRPLPEKGKPDDFSGAVGRFTMEADLGRKEVREGESSTLTITIRGEGDLSGVTRPAISGIKDFKLYNDQPKIARKAEGERILSEKTFKTALVPLKSGLLKIPPISFSFFNPEEGAYQHVMTHPFEIRVLPSARTETTHPVEPEAAHPSKKTVKMIGRDILPIATDLKGSLDRSFSPFSPAAGIVFVLPFLSYTIVFLLKKRRDRLARDPGYARRITAFRTAHREIRKVRALSTGKDGNQDALIRLDRTLRNYLGDKLDLAGKARTASEWSRELARTLHDRILLDETVSLLREFEQIRFSPEYPVTEDAGRLIRKVDTVISRLEKTL